MWHRAWMAIVLTSWILAAAPGAQSRPPIASIDAAIAEMESGSPERADEALGYVLANLSLARTDVLLMFSVAALQLERLEDAGFLFYAGQLRWRVDEQRFPPAGRGGDSPAVAIGALQQIIGAEINPAVMREPQTLGAVLNRLEAWDIETAAGYDPGWEYATALSADEAPKVAQTVRADYLRRGRGIHSLLGVPEYLAALRESQDASQGDLSDKAKLNAAMERMRNAQERMCEIEKTLKIEGVCGPLQ